jgi:hypothetical protein
MKHSNRMTACLIAAVVIVAVFATVGASRLLALPLILVACPLMMFVMMRGMNHHDTIEDHTGHGCEHDPTRTTETSPGPRL